MVGRFVDGISVGVGVDVGMQANSWVGVWGVMLGIGCCGLGEIGTVDVHYWLFGGILWWMAKDVCYSTELPALCIFTSRKSTSLGRGFLHLHSLHSTAICPILHVEKGRFVKVLTCTLYLELGIRSPRTE